MIGDTKGYLLLKDLDNVFIGYDELISKNIYDDIKSKIQIYPLRIIDIATDNNGFMCMEPLGRCIIDVQDMSSVNKYFICDEFNGILVPPNLTQCEIINESIKRTLRKGGYDKCIKAAVIINSLNKGIFDDSFLDL